MLETLLTFALTVFTGFFAIMNPIANIPIFIGMMEGKDKKSQRVIAKTATITAFFIVFFFVLLGKYIFEIFDITIPTFKLAGGLLIFYVGFNMLQSKKKDQKDVGENATDDGIAISPLAIPILAGPGTIVTAMNYAADADYIELGIIIVIFALITYLTFVAFTLSDLIVKKMGNSLIKVIGKIMGLILAIIGTGMAVEGIKLAFNLKS
ncbi:MAG: MarC family protein [Cyclobacteriaceae bacterium]|jgi:multiple antibiotic resistance protein|nr:MarC family protein [Cyclobacteriaceae bacterium]